MSKNETLSLEVFDSPEFGQMRILREGDKYLFCANDAAVALGYGHHREIITADIKALETNLAELENAKNETEEQITGEMKWKFMIQRFYDAREMTAEMADAFIESMKLHEDGSLEIKLSYMDEFAALMNTCERLRKEVA